MIFSLRISMAHLTCLSRVSTKPTPVFDESLHLGVRVMHISNVLKLFCKQKCLLGAATFIFCAILLVKVTPQIQIPDSGIKQTGRQVLRTKYVKWKEQSTFEIEMEHCSCKRRIKTQPNFVIDSRGELTNTTIFYNKTTCGKDAFARGSGQKVVAFAFYGDIHTEVSIKKGYFEGIEGNLGLMPKYYPGYTMRVYYDLDDADPIMEELCQLACNNDILDICNVKELPGTPISGLAMYIYSWQGDFYLGGGVAASRRYLL